MQLLRHQPLLWSLSGATKTQVIEGMEGKGALNSADFYAKCQFSSGRPTNPTATVLSKSSLPKQGLWLFEPITYPGLVTYLICTAQFGLILSGYYPNRRCQLNSCTTCVPVRGNSFMSSATGFFTSSPLVRAGQLVSRNLSYFVCFSRIHSRRGRHKWMSPYSLCAP